MRSRLQADTYTSRFEELIAMSIPIRILFSVKRSGSTLFMRLMSNIEGIAVTSRTILMGNYYKEGNHRSGSHFNTGGYFRADYSIYNEALGKDAVHEKHPAVVAATLQGARCLVSKEELGNNVNWHNDEYNECDFPLFPSNSALCSVRPVFLFRHPLSCFASWYKLGWNDIDSFKQSYVNLHQTAALARLLRPETVIYKLEDLTHDIGVAANVLRAVCNDWELPYSENVLSLEGHFADRLLFWHPREEQIYRQDNPKGIFSTLQSARAIFTPPDQTHVLPISVRKRIESEILELYDGIDTSGFYRSL